MTTPNWSNGIANCPITAIHVAADGPNGWALSAVGDLYYYNDSQTSWQEITTPPSAVGIIVRISSASDSSLIAVTSENEVYHYYGSTWVALSINCSNSLVAAASASNFVYRDSVGDFNKMLNGILAIMPSGPISNVVQLSTVPALDHIWAITNETVYDNVFFWAIDWRPIPGKNLKQFDLHHNSTTNQVQPYGVDRSGNGWLYNFSTNQWNSVAVPAFGTKFRTLESSSGFIWASINTASNNVLRGTI